MIRPMVPVKAVWLAAALVAGCAKHMTKDDPEPQFDRNTPVSLEVENHNWSDMVIYLDRGQLSQRLGTVGTLHTEIFSFPYLQLGPTGNARLRADPIGNLRSFSSEYINIQPGQSLKWTIENDIDRSFLSAY